MKKYVLATAKIFHPYIPAMVNSVERWLGLKASNGWRLEDVRGWNFTFRKCNPYKTRYFSYSGFGANIGISHDYWASKRRYARSRSVINKASLQIYEVDLKKIDKSFNDFVLLRNKYYLKHYCALLVFSIIYIILGVAILSPSGIWLVFSLIGFALFAYSFISLLTLIYEIKLQKKGTALCSD